MKPLVRFGAPADVIQTINYNSTPEWDQEVATLTNGKKVDFVIEISGRATLGKSIRSTRLGGLVAISGYLSDYSELDPKVKEEGEHCSPMRRCSVANCSTLDLAKTLLYSAVSARGNFVGTSPFILTLRWYAHTVSFSYRQQAAIYRYEPRFRDWRSSADRGQGV